MLFTIVIAVRNENKYIQRCLNGVFNQNIKRNFEVIVVDGMSTDGTYETLIDLKKQYNFTLIGNKKLNAAAGRNLGIKKSKGTYIAFIDADAIPSPDWLTNIHHIISKQKDNVAGVGGPDNLPKDSIRKSKRIGYIMTSSLARGGKFNPSTQHSLMDEERFVDHIPTCNLCLKKDILKTVGLFDEDFVKGQDLELNYRIIKAGFKLLYSPKIKVVHYRKNHIRSFIKQIFKWSKAKVAIIKKHGINGITSHIYLWPIYTLLILLCATLVFSIFQSLPLFSAIILFISLTYFSLIMYEGSNLSKKYNDIWLILYTFFLIPIVHFTYALGILSAIYKKSIW
jgi:GT2 family glycosyltransferase